MSDTAQSNRALGKLAELQPYRSRAQKDVSFVQERQHATITGWLKSVTPFYLSWKVVWQASWLWSHQSGLVKECQERCRLSNTCIRCHWTTARTCNNRLLQTWNTVTHHSIKWLTDAPQRYPHQPGTEKYSKGLNEQYEEKDSSISKIEGATNWMSVSHESL